MSDRAVNGGLPANLLAAMLVLMFIAAAAVFSYQSSTLNVVRGPSPNYLLASLRAKDGGSRVPLIIPPADALKVALKAQPLSPAIVNAAIFAEVARKQGSRPQPAKIALLEKLGWRNTPALQNRIVYALERRDIGKIVVIADALLRRNDLTKEGYALMHLMELDRLTRQQLVTALAKRPTWRQGYFNSQLPVTSPQAINARVALAKALAAQGQSLSRPELYPTLKLLVAKGYSQDGYSLWRMYRNVRKPPLISDSNFVWAYQQRNNEQADMPFEWELGTGSGFWTELINDKGAYALTINWDHQGVPVMLRQQLYMGNPKPKLMLRINGTDLPSGLLDNLSFVLTCPQGQAYFDRVIGKSRSRYVLTTDDQISCNSPTFRIVGRPLRGVAYIGGGSEAFSVTIKSIALQPLGDNGV